MTAKIVPAKNILTAAEKYRIECINKVLTTNTDNKEKYLYIIPKDIRYAPFPDTVTAIGRKYLRMHRFHYTENRFSIVDFNHVDEYGIEDDNYMLHASKEAYETYCSIHNKVIVLGEMIARKLPYQNAEKLEEILKLLED